MANDPAVAARMYCHLCFGDIDAGDAMVRTLLDKLINATRVRVNPAVRCFFRVCQAVVPMMWCPWLAGVLHRLCTDAGAIVSGRRERVGHQ